MRGKNAIKRCSVTNVRMLESVKRAVGNCGHVLQASRIGQRIKVHHLVPALHSQPHYGRTNKASTACDKKFHRLSFELKRAA